MTDNFPQRSEMPTFVLHVKDIAAVKLSFDDLMLCCLRVKESYVCDLVAYFVHGLVDNKPHAVII